MSAWEELRGILINGSPVTAAGDRVRTDAGNEDDAYPFVIGRRVAVERSAPTLGMLGTFRRIPVAS